MRTLFIMPIILLSLLSSASWGDAGSTNHFSQYSNLKLCQFADIDDLAMLEAERRGLNCAAELICTKKIADNAFDINVRTTEVQVKHMIELCNCGFGTASTASMANSTYETSKCLENIVLKLMSVVTKQTRKASSEQVNKMRRGYVEMLSEVYHGYVGCDGSCGSMWSGMATSNFNGVLSDLALEIVRRQNY